MPTSVLSLIAKINLHKLSLGQFFFFFSSLNLISNGGEAIVFFSKTSSSNLMQYYYLITAAYISHPCLLFANLLQVLTHCILWQTIVHNIMDLDTLNISHILTPLLIIKGFTAFGFILFKSRSWTLHHVQKALYVYLHTSISNYDHINLLTVLFTFMY